MTQCKGLVRYGGVSLSVGGVGCCGVQVGRGMVTCGHCTVESSLVMVRRRGVLLRYGRVLRGPVTLWRRMVQ